MRDHQIFDPEIETRPPEAQFKLDRETYSRQIRYLFENSPFYQQKLSEAGFDTPEKAGGLDDIAALPFTEKDEIRASQVNYPPFGNHLAADADSLVRVFSTSGTTGTPCYLSLTRADLDMYATNVARGYSAAGFKPGQRLVVGFNAGPFVAGAVYYGFDKIGCSVIPVGTGNTERMVTAIRKLGATGVSCTPSYGLYLIDWCRDAGIETESLGLQNMITAGEPGGGDPFVRQAITDAFGCTVRESMGIGDISLSVWAEDADENGMHFIARGYVHAELIDPATGQPVPWEDGAEGELVYTALQREAMPMLRFRSRDHVVVTLKDNPTGRTGPRIRCIGRTDDMLIVRGVNLFPTAIRSVLESFSDEVSGIFSIRPKTKGVLQTPPLPMVVEVAHGTDTENPELAKRIKDEIKARLLVTSEIRLVAHGSLPRETYKTKLGGRFPPRTRAQELWRVAPEFLAEAHADAMRLAVEDQVRAGVDIITDGEACRESYSNHFATALDGIDIDNPGTALDRSGEPVPVPRIAGKIQRRHAVSVEEVKLLRSLTDRKIKLTVPGPFTMSQQAQNDYYPTLADAAMDYAEAVRQEIADLFAAGADIVQLDEPYMQARPEAAEQYGIEALNTALQGASGPTCVHICFGYAMLIHERPEGYSFLPQLANACCQQISIETAQSNLDCSVLQSIPEQTILLGVIDLSTPEVETPETIVERVNRALPYIDKERVILAPDCGMKYLPRESSLGKLQSMVEAARRLREQHSA